MLKCLNNVSLGLIIFLVAFYVYSVINIIIGKSYLRMIKLRRKPIIKNLVLPSFIGFNCYMFMRIFDTGNTGVVITSCLFIGVLIWSWNRMQVTVVFEGSISEIENILDEILKKSGNEFDTKKVIDVWRDGIRVNKKAFIKYGKIGIQGTHLNMVFIRYNHINNFENVLSDLSEYLNKMKKNYSIEAKIVDITVVTLVMFFAILFMLPKNY